MEKREIGKSGIFASPVALGAWAIGGGPWWGESDDQESIKTIHCALDNGIDLIDTAPLYGYGRSEEVIGKAMKGRRSQVILSTKCGLWWKDERGSFFFEQDGYKVNRSLAPETIKIEIEDSLRRLKTDYIDVYHTHWQSIPPYFTPVEETMECLLALQKEGKIRSIAVSNADVPCMKEYLQKGNIDVNQIKYSMLDRSAEEAQIPFCLENKISILAYSPLEQGLLTGRITMETSIEKDEFRNSLPWYKPENRIQVLDMLKGWTNLTEKYNCELSQLVISWTMSQPAVSHVLCGARKIPHVEENVKAGEVKIEKEDLEKMTLALSILKK